MIEDTNPAQPADMIMGGIEVTLGHKDFFIGRFDVMIDVGELYSNN